MLGRPQDWPYRNGERNSIAFTEGKRIKYYVLTRHQTFIKLSSNFYQTFIKLPSKLPSWKHSKISKNLNSLAVHCSTRMLDFSIHSSWTVFRRKLATGGPWWENPKIDGAYPAKQWKRFLKNLSLIWNCKIDQFHALFSVYAWAFAKTPHLEFLA